MNRRAAAARRRNGDSHSERVRISKLVHGGQGLGELADGRKVFVWNALPGEEVEAKLIASKKSYAEAVATEVYVESPQRVAPREPSSYLATSPWQILEFNAENEYKKQILTDAFEREGIIMPAYEFVHVGEPYGYRNKMEWGFWGDETGISLAHFVRGSHGKTKVVGSELAQGAINDAAASVVAQLNTLPELRAGDLKSLIVRAGMSANGEHHVVAALFVKKEEFPRLTLPAGLLGLVVYFSNPKSPASLPTRVLQELGDRTLTSTVLGRPLNYDVLSFFQVNVPVFEQAVIRIKTALQDTKKLDFYSGVGSIGILVEGTSTLVESDPANILMARQNAKELPIKVIEASAEKALDYIDAEHTLIVDPPRAGLHAHVVQRIAGVRPPTLAYLSCNPSTQARDIALLVEAGYKVTLAEGYNFFPRTPHIESLVILALA